MRIFAITKSGLIALTIAVATLWTCLGVEIALRHRLDRETAASIQRLARLRQFTPPAQVENPARKSEPLLRAHRPFTS